jgi:two-component system, NtrC family, sensor kinase
MMGHETIPSPMRWYHSLIFRVILSCVVLVLCLLGSVYVISQFYLHQLVDEMEKQSLSIAENVEILLKENPEEDLANLADSLGDGVVLEEIEGESVPMHVTFEAAEDGRLHKVARTTFAFGDQTFLVTVRVPVLAQQELIRAFKNRYMAMLTAVFLATLGFMVYLIAKLLRPLSDLSQSCARISQGELANVDVRKNSREIVALEETFNRMVTSLHEKDVVEAKLRQAQRLSALGNLAAGIAHDVRNPLNAIKLISSHAIDTLDAGPGNETSARQLQTIRTEVNRLDDIVTRFLSLAKETEIQPEPCRVDELLEECTRLVKQDAEARGVRLAMELRAGNTDLMLDHKQFTRAILNVLLNALEACPKDGRVRLFSRVTDQACEIEVRDDGPGLSAETAECAFDPYFTTRPTGTGLGLSITRGIVEEHGGVIALSSVEGQGCQVLITMPLQSNERTQT